MEFHQAKKSLGQNFLMHAQTAKRIAQVAGIEGKTVLEVGPGTGMLTRALLTHASKVIAVEADRELIPELEKEFDIEIRTQKLDLVHADIREFDPNSVNGSYAVVANIPYYITGEIIRKFLTAEHKPVSMTLLVQKEVAVRIAREKKGSVLSLSVKAYGVPSYEFTVPRGAFIPAPNVDSAVLSIRDIASPWSTATEEKRFFEVLKAGFAHKRKFLVRNLEDVAPRERVVRVFKELSLSEKTRAEELSRETWLTLSTALS